MPENKVWLSVLGTRLYSCCFLSSLVVLCNHLTNILRWSGVLTVIMCAFSQGSVLFNYFSHGKLERSEGSSITEGQLWSSPREKVNIILSWVSSAVLAGLKYILCGDVWIYGTYIFVAHMSALSVMEIQQCNTLMHAIEYYLTSMWDCHIIIVNISWNGLKGCTLISACDYMIGQYGLSL